jgi:MoxR-like ATPase
VTTAAPPTTAPSSARGTTVHEATAALREELGKRIVGLDEVVEQVLIAILTEHHALLEGVPGLAKTLLISSIAGLVDLSFARIQFTPDLMPSDVTGTEVLGQDANGARSFRFLEGPIFANVILADEINRTPPKTQASLMEAMEERSVTSLGVRRPLDRPFFVLATQNPIEQQGTYPLPAAQLDRFLFKIRLDYPSWDEEARIVRLTTATLVPPPPRPILSKADLLGHQLAIANADVELAVVRYAVELARASRPTDALAPTIVKDYVQWGVGPRAPQALVAAAKARAFLRGRARATIDDVRALAPAIFRHRLIPSYAAEADGVGADDITKGLLDTVPYPGRAEARRERGPVARFLRRLLALDFREPKL